MRKTNLEDIRSVIHRVRATAFPELDERFLNTVLEIEASSAEDDAGAQRRIREAVAQRESES
jgi:hypothetical protein